MSCSFVIRISSFIRHSGLVILVLACSASFAQAPNIPSHWWNPLWPYRVRIDCPAALGETAQISAILAGRSSDDGRDLRLVDEDGKQQPFEIIFHDAQQQTLLAFKAPDGKPISLWLYFGNKHAEKIHTQQPDSRVQPWQPQAGVLLRTYHKGEEKFPKTLPEFLEMIPQSKLEGGDFVTNISQGHDLFGVSNQYMSVYHAWLRIDTPGTYSFCTVSADGSWVQINDKMLVESPGPHGWNGMEHGEKNGSIQLAKGIAKIDYYQETGKDAHMAYLGWKPPSADHFVGIPNQQWVDVRNAMAAAYESRDKPIMAVPDVQLFSSYWLPDSSDKQISLLRLDDRSMSRDGKITQINWDFGDGQTATGPHQRHVYFRLGRPTVQLSVTDSKGNTDSITCQPNIILQDVQAPDVRFGNADNYAQMAANYDVQKMPQEDLSLYAQFWQKLEKWSQFAAAAKVYIQKFPDAPDAGYLAAAAADACADAQAFDPNTAEQLYGLAIDKLADPDVHQSLLFRRAKNLAWNLNRLDDAKAIYRQLIESAGTNKPGKITVREATIGIGDVEMLGGNFPAAKDMYTRAEQMSDRKAQDQSVELAKLGSYPWTVEDYLARGDYDEAIDTLNEWEDNYPLQKLEGTSLLLRGKVLYVRQPAEPVLKYLQLAEAVNPSGTQVPETVWLRANCLMALGKYKEALDQFARVSTEFTRSEFAGKTKDKIDECERKLKSSAASQPR